MYISNKSSSYIFNMSSINNVTYITVSWVKKLFNTFYTSYTIALCLSLKTILAYNLLFYEMTQLSSSLINKKSYFSD